MYVRLWSTNKLKKYYFINNNIYFDPQVIWGWPNIVIRQNNSLGVSNCTTFSMGVKSLSDFRSYIVHIH